MTHSESVHKPVLFQEVLDSLDPQPGQTIVDGTMGGGGHATAIAERVGAAGRVIALDRDQDAIARAETKFEGLPVTVLHANYRKILAALEVADCEQVDGILLDLGLSSDQLEDRQRGFSFQSDAPLDMRMDQSLGDTAADLLRYTEETALANIIYQYGEERLSRRIARKIVERRKTDPIETATELADLIQRCVPASGGRGKPNRIHPATRTFQALRIAVNDELGALEQVLKDAPDALRPGGKLAIISFHSLEDRLVKHTFRADERYGVLTRKPIRPTELEISQNPRSRSSRLRVAERV